MCLPFLGVHRFAEFFTNSEPGNAFRGNLQWLVRLRVSAGPSFALTRFESSEAYQSNSLTRGDAFDNRIHHYVDNCFRVFFGGACFSCNYINQFCFVQDASTPSYGAIITEIP